MDHSVVDLPVGTVPEALDEFFSLEARDMFRSMTLDADCEKEQRLAALNMLADIWTVWGPRRANDRRLPDSAEQQETIDQLLKLLKGDDPDFHRGAASAILTWSHPGPGAESLQSRIELRAAPALVAFFAQNPRVNVPWSRDYWIIRVIGKDEWQRLGDRK
jgi:hypothetical protein